VEQTGKSIMVRATDIKHGCAVFDGNNGTHISSSSAVLDSITNTFTIELGIKRQDKLSASVAVSKDSWKVELSGGTVPRLALTGEDNTVRYFSAPTLAQDAWNQLSFAVTATSVSVYHNGALQSNTALASPTKANSAPLTLGANDSGQAGHKGFIDEVRIWDHARTTQQIKDNFNRVLKPQQGLVAYYKLDGNALDSSGNGFHGTVNGGVAWSVDGRVNDVGQVAKFDGVDDEINTTDTIDLNNKSFSIGFWAKVDSTTDLALISHGRVSVNNGLHILIRNTSIKFNFYGNDYSLAVTMTPNVWHYWTFTYDASTLERKIYRNGVLLGVQTSIAAYAGIGVFYIGSYFALSSVRYNGAINLITVWSKALTQQETQSNMFKVLPSTTTGLIEQWTLNGHALGTKGNNGTLVGGTKFVADVPQLKADVSPTLQKNIILQSSANRILTK
jgi:hypothetical protein